MRLLCGRIIRQNLDLFVSSSILTTLLGSLSTPPETLGYLRPRVAPLAGPWAGSKAEKKPLLTWGQVVGSVEAILSSNVSRESRQNADETEGGRGRH